MARGPRCGSESRHTRAARWAHELDDGVSHLDAHGHHWRGSDGELARDHGLCVVGVSSVGMMRHGPWADWPVIGASLAVGPAGVLAQAPFGAAALVVVELPASEGS